MSAPKVSAWAGASGSNAGWVPSITGQLSYSLMAEGVRSCVRTTELLPDQRRAVLAQQRRVANDDPKPWVWRVWTWASADFLMVGETQAAGRTAEDGSQVVDAQGVLTGKLVLLQQHSGALQGRRNRIVRRLRRLIARFNEENKLETLLEKVDRTLEGARKPLEGVGALVFPEAQFALYRSGEFRLRMVPETLPAAFLDKHGEPVSDAELSLYQDDFAKALSTHFFYFVRDLSHRHYHHAPDSDALLELLPADVSDDVTWRRETLYALGRAVLEARREDDLLNYKQAEGFAAYARAFHELLGARRRDPSNFDRQVDDDLSPQYLWEPLLASIAVRSAEKVSKYAGRMQLLALVLPALLAVFALWVAIAQVQGALGLDVNAKDARVTEVRWLVESLYYQPLQFTFWTILGAWGIFEFVGRGFARFRFLELWIDRFKRFGYASAGSVAMLVRRNFPNVADQVGAYFGGAVLSVLTALTFDFAIALARANAGNALVVKALAGVIHSLLGAVEWGLSLTG